MGGFGPKTIECPSPAFSVEWMSALPFFAFAISNLEPDKKGLPLRLTSLLCRFLLQDQLVAQAEFEVASFWGSAIPAASAKGLPKGLQSGISWPKLGPQNKGMSKTCFRRVNIIYLDGTSVHVNHTAYDTV